MTETSRLTWAFDPGHITGFVAGKWNRESPLKVVEVAAVLEDELLDFLYSHAGVCPDDVIVEGFKLRTNNSFAADPVAKKVEGILTGALGSLTMRPPTKKEQVPDRVLKENGLWQTGKTVDWTDGRDVNDAIIHLLGFVAFDQRHLPTLRKYFRKEKND